MVAIYIFGSRVAGLAIDRSDYDIAILGKEKYSTIDLFALKNTIETECKIEVDLVDLKAASTVTCFEMLKTGERLFAADEGQADQFEYLTISYYQKLQEERRDILEDIKSRGSVYG